MDMKRFFLYFITIAALALAGCGGGGKRPLVDGGCDLPQVPAPGGGCMNPTPQGPTAEEIAAATDAAATKMTAIMAEAAQETDDGLGGADATDDHMVSIMRDKDGLEVEITVVGAGMDDPKFIQAMDFGDGRTMHVRDISEMDSDETVEEVVIVDTDIDAPKATPFNDEYPLDTNRNDATPPVAQSFTVNTGNVEMWSSTGFPSTAGTTREYVEDDDTTMDMNEGEVAGMFDGAPGTFECISSTCSLVTDADGKLMTVGGTWQFTPAGDAMVYVADADYMHYGFWLKKTTDADGTIYNEVQTFAMSSIDPSGSVAQVRGSATYNGGATGVYTRNNEYNSASGEVINAESGHFTADVTLEAYFSGDDVAVSKHNTITGKIDGFNLYPTVATGGPEDSEWSVALKGAIDTGAGTAAGTANGGGAEGNFNATFHGSVAAFDHDDDTTTTDIPRQPGSAVGEFDAVFGNGSAAGGFGARKQ